MSVIIDKLHTRCGAPRGQTVLRGLIDRLARDRLVSEFARHAGPDLFRHGSIVRIRRLNVRLRIRGNHFDESAIAAMWAQAFTQSLLETLLLPNSTAGGRIVRATSEAEFRAAFLRDRLNGQAEKEWDYTEFKDLLRVPLTDAALTLLLSHPSDIIEILSFLNKGQVLDRLLAQTDDRSLEKLFAAMGGSIDLTSGEDLTYADLFWCAERIPERSQPQGFAFDSRQHALSLFLRAEGGKARSPRTIYHLLLVLTCLLECPQILDADDQQAPASIGNVERCTGRQLPRDVSGLILTLRKALLADWAVAEMSPDKFMGRLIDSLDHLRPLVPTAAPVAPAKIPWREVDSASLLLLARSVIRLGWADLRNESWLSSRDSPRFFQALLAGIGSSVLGRGPLDKQPLHPAAALFAGIEQEPDMAGLRQVLESVDVAGRRRLLARLAPGSATAAAENWNETFSFLATKLVQEFASLIMGFREASASSTIRQFLRTPGRVRVNHQVISVLLSSNPGNVALHISGLDDPLASVNWMGDRRLEFHLQGL